MLPCFLAAHHALSHPQTHPRGSPRHSADDFKPQSIDYSQPGKLNIEKNRVQVRLQGTEDKEYIFKGNATDAKDTECVLIFDEARKVFVLERLSNAIILKQVRHPPPPPPPLHRLIY